MSTERNVVDHRFALMVMHVHNGQGGRYMHRAHGESHSNKHTHTHNTIVVNNCSCGASNLPVLDAGPITDLEDVIKIGAQRPASVC